MRDIALIPVFIVLLCVYILYAGICYIMEALGVDY
jgi:hypothetical protein